jgi:hypothetical protein
MTSSPAGWSCNIRTTQTRLKSFELDELVSSDAMKVITHGVLDGGGFSLKK